MPTVIVRHPDGSEHEHELSGELTIGRAEGNDLILDQGGVSRRHARFFVTARGEVMVEDSGSANGTFVDGEKIGQPTPVKARAQVVIGDYELSVVGAGGATARPARLEAPPPRPWPVRRCAGSPAPGPTRSFRCAGSSPWVGSAGWSFSSTTTR